MKKETGQANKIEGGEMKLQGMTALGERLHLMREVRQLPRAGDKEGETWCGLYISSGQGGIIATQLHGPLCTRCANRAPHPYSTTCLPPE